MANNKKKQYKTLLAVLANGATAEANALLKKYSGETAQNTQDLANKLERAYVLAPYKKDIEKEFAEIHPHKDFILKYVKPVEEIKPLKAETIVKEVTTENEPTVVKQVVAHDGYSNMNGHPPCGNQNCPRCKEFFANANGDNNCPCSRCSGYSNASGNEVKAPTDYVGLIGMVAVVGVVFFVLTKTVK